MIICIYLDLHPFLTIPYPSDLWHLFDRHQTNFMPLCFYWLQFQFFLLFNLLFWVHKNDLSQVICCTNLIIILIIANLIQPKIKCVTNLTPKTRQVLNACEWVCACACFFGIMINFISHIFIRNSPTSWWNTVLSTH